MPQDSIPFHLSQKEAGVFKNTALVLFCDLIVTFCLSRLGYCCHTVT